MKKTYERIFIVLIVFIVLGLLLRLLAPMIWGNYYGGYSNHMFGGMMFPIGMLGMAAFWLIVIVFVFGLINKDGQDDKDSAIETLKKRLSKGDITIDEYEELKTRIRKE
ncbi:SHOCT domain-containing protein [Mycoplasmatota bacterium]|nr:SHOCT domain-containing protein [Mycoplasmatota bacterium]